MSKKYNPIKKFRPEYGWIESNEPEEHLDKVAIKINENFKLIENILCFSYKDLSLANRVRYQNSNVDILFANKKGLLGEIILKKLMKKKFLKK